MSEFKLQYPSEYAENILVSEDQYEMYPNIKRGQRLKSLRPGEIFGNANFLEGDFRFYEFINEREAKPLSIHEMYEDKITVKEKTGAACDYGSIPIYPQMTGGYNLVWDSEVDVYGRKRAKQRGRLVGTNVTASGFGAFCGCREYPLHDYELEDKEDDYELEDEEDNVLTDLGVQLSYPEDFRESTKKEILKELRAIRGLLQENNG